MTFTDVIPDTERDYFNGFESLPASTDYKTSYHHDNILVRQVNGTDRIMTFFSAGGGKEGFNSWYPSTADFGYTSISLVNQSKMQAIGMLIGSGWGMPVKTIYSLRNDSTEVEAGSFTSLGPYVYVGFKDLIFDEVWLRNGAYPPVEFNDGTQNALALDSIEVKSAGFGPSPAPVPLPLPLSMLTASLASLVCLRGKIF